MMGVEYSDIATNADDRSSHVSVDRIGFKLRHQKGAGKF